MMSIYQEAVAGVVRWRAAGILFLAVLFGAATEVMAQPASMQPRSAELPAVSSSVLPSEGPLALAAPEMLPDEPGLQSQSVEAGRNISGTVTDMHGALVAGATVVLSSADSRTGQTLTTDGDGFFSFAGVQAGRYRLKITSAGFSPWVSAEIVLQPGQSYYVPRISLQIAQATSSIDVVPTRYEIAQEQVELEEKQRVLAIFPNFYVSYIWNAAPLSSGQKFRLAVKSIVDPGSFLATGFEAGVEQWQNDYREWGQGAQGYATRYAADFGDGVIDTMISGAILPSMLHQDPRYFYKGTGTIRSRALYAIATVVICKGDNGRWQPNYSNVIGNFVAAGISNAYYPPADRGARLTVDNTLIGFGAGAVGDLFQEFLIKKISRGVHP